MKALRLSLTVGAMVLAIPAALFGAVAVGVWLFEPAPPRRPLWSGP